MNSNRLILRNLKKTDCKELTEQGNDKDINFFNWYIPFPFKESDAKKIILERIENPKLKYRKQSPSSILSSMFSVLSKSKKSKSISFPCSFT